MTGTLYTGNATLPGPTQVQLTVDNDPQRATTYDPGLQALADMIACLRKQTYQRHGSTADMQAVSDATIGDPFFVSGQGTFSLISGGLPEQHPWIYNATGMADGSQWMHELFQSVLDAKNPARMKSSLLPSGTTGQMQAVTGAIEGSAFLVPQIGWFTYTTAFYIPISPFIYSATGMGTGLWVSTLLLSVLGQLAPPKIQESLIPNKQIIQCAPVYTASAVAQHVATVSPTQTRDTGSNPLSTTISGARAGDLLEFQVGPFIINPTVFSKTHARVRVTQDAVESIWEDSAGNPIVGFPSDYRSTVFFDGLFASTSTSDITVVVEHWNGTTGDSGTINTPGAGVQWGPAGQYQWAKYKLIRG